MTKKEIRPPQATIKRLSAYLQTLDAFESEGTEVVSSWDLASKLDFNPAQVRKDLAYFGEFGKRGVGYSLVKLRKHIIEILGLDRKRNVGIIGAGGRLGKALASYSGFEKRNFQILALFDNDPKVIGQVIGNNLVIRPVSEVPETVARLGIEILMLTVPVSAVNEVFKLAQAAKVKAVLNFAPLKLSSTADITVNNVDLAMELESLSYHINLHEKRLKSRTAEIAHTNRR